MRKSSVMYGAILLVTVGLVFVACVSTKSILLIPGEEYAPVPTDSVRIYTMESELDTLEYVRVALIEATGSSGWTSQSGMYKAMRKKAASLGCNGILLPQISEASAGAKVAGAFLGTGTQRRGQAVAIRVIGKKKKQPEVKPVEQPAEDSTEVSDDDSDDETE